MPKLQSPHSLKGQQQEDMRYYKMSICFKGKVPLNKPFLSLVLLPIIFTFMNQTEFPERQKSGCNP